MNPLLAYSACIGRFLLVMRVHKLARRGGVRLQIKQTKTKEKVLDEICKMQQHYVRDLDTLRTQYLRPMVPIIARWVAEGVGDPNQRLQYGRHFGTFFEATIDLIDNHQEALERLQASIKCAEADAGYSIDQGVAEFLMFVSDLRYREV